MLKVENSHVDMLVNSSLLCCGDINPYIFYRAKQNCEILFNNFVKRFLNLLHCVYVLSYPAKTNASEYSAVGCLPCSLVVNIRK